MADDRPVGDIVDDLGKLKKVVEDLRSTLMARSTRLPTGMFVGTWLATAPPDTLLLDGSTPLRASYPGLWQYVQSNDLIAAGVFTVGNGTTTFGLPDWRGKVLRGKGASEAVGQAVGSDSLMLSTAQLPSHTHTAGNAGNHGHSFSTDPAGSHGNHVGQAFNAAGGGVATITADNTGNTSTSSHAHTGGTTNVADHTHTIGSTGSGTAVDLRQASIAVNWLVYV